MQILREVPPRWWAILVGVAFGSLALIAMNGPTKGYAKSVIAAVLTAPFLSIIAGAMLNEETTLEAAAFVGGVVASGGMAVILAVSKMAPTLVTAALTGAAQSYLEITPTEKGKHPKVRRIENVEFPDEDKETPEDSKELDELIDKIDKYNRSDYYES